MIALSNSLPYIQFLDLGYNKLITSIGYKALSNQICDSEKRNENSLNVLQLMECNLNDECIIALSKSIPSIEILELSYSRNITLTGFNEMSQWICDSVLQNRNKLKRLFLSSCKLNDEIIIALSKLIPFLELVDLSDNANITSKGFKEISQCIGNSHKRNECLLKELVLKNCGVDDESKIALTRSAPYLEVSY